MRLHLTAWTPKTWKLAHWGAPADTEAAELTAESEAAIRYRFYTASSPPLRLITWLAETRAGLLFDLAWIEPSARFTARLNAVGTDRRLRESDGSESLLEVLAGSGL